MSSSTQQSGSRSGLHLKRLILVDDHRLIREGLRQILQAQPDLVIVGESDTGHGALSLLEQARADVAIVDLNLPGLSGMNLISRIRSEHPACAVLVLSMYAEELYAMRALKAGAQGYLTKDTAADELVRAVHKVAAGGCYLSRGMAERVAMAVAQQDTTPGMSDSPTGSWKSFAASWPGNASAKSRGSCTCPSRPSAPTRPGSCRRCSLTAPQR